MTKQITKEKPILSRPETVGLAKRLLKSDDLYEPKRDLMILYRLFKQYPNRQFWEHFDLGFKLNCLLWLVGKDGREQIARNWSLFNLDLKPQEQYKVEEMKQGEDFEVKKKPKTIADLLK